MPKNSAQADALLELNKLEMAWARLVQDAAATDQTVEPDTLAEIARVRAAILALKK
jgi:hypothetical protein